MRFALKTAVTAFALCGCSAFPAVRVTLRNGAEVQAASVVREAEGLVLGIGTGTITVPADQVQEFETIPETAAVPSANASSSSLEPRALLIDASKAQALPPEFLESVARVESGLRIEAVSKKGAIGLMQLMPGTAADLGVHATAPADNALGGAKYLRQLLLRYHGDTRLALAAYNAGPAAVDRYRGVPPFRETVEYVNRVLGEYYKIKKAQSGAPKAKAPNSIRAMSKRPTENAKLD